MQAITYHKYGSADVLQLEERPRPVVGSGEVLVRIRAAALNPVDCEIRRGMLRPISSFGFPRIPGSDFAGEVVEAGPGVKHLGPGDPVYGMASPLSGGAYAEYIALKKDQLALMPKGITFEEAAAVPLVALTALQALRDLAHIKAGQEVFIHGGSGGVGTVAIQLAKFFDARVTTSCSYRNTELVRELGADEVIDYTKQDLTKLENKYDIYFDVYGNMPFRRVKHLIRPKGRHVTTIIAPVNFLTAFWTRLRPGKQARVVVVKSKAADLELIREIVEAGQLKPVVDKTYPLADAAAAQKYLETKRASGKVVLKVE